ncbi:transmembrane channel-like protein 7 isoform X2 [Bacillus rossius redtenbacheri]
MLPDLSENLSNEERTWEEIMQIKAMPVSMTQKKELKAKLQSATKLRLQGYEQFKYHQRKRLQHLKNCWKETYAKLELWHYSLKKIEGNFGTGVVSYFLFIKWLMFLNLAIFLLVFLFVILPEILLGEQFIYSCNVSDFNFSLVECCSESYWNTSTSDGIVLDLIQGKGIIEKTVLFYGLYSSKIYTTSEDSGLYYNLPLAYIAITVLSFLLSLVAIVKSAAKGFKERLIEGEGQFYKYCNLVFAGWDFCIHNEKSAAIKHKALFNEIKGNLEAERLEEERQNRSREEKTKLIVIRCIINLVVLMVLAGAAFLIYISFDFSNNELEAITQKNKESTHLYSLLMEFLPSVAIVGLNLFVPILFGYLVTFERYSPQFVVRLTLFRTVFLRLSSLIMLLVTLYNVVMCRLGDCNKAHDYCGDPQCWETYVGQQFYKLVLLDFVTNVVITFMFNFPRMLIAKHSKSRVAKFIGEQEFELPRHVLDVVYTQTLCWLGSFYAPSLPLFAGLQYFFIFYIKKFACLVNSTPSSTVYRASRSNSFFMLVLLLSFVVAVVPVTYSVAELLPSSGCGPFRGQDTVWQLVVSTFEKLPSWIQSILFFFSTAGFAVPAFIILVLCLYYYYAVSAANKHMVLVLKNQLVLEGHDKQFLLNRLSAFIKQQQQQHDHHKVMRQMEMTNPADASGAS